MSSDLWSFSLSTYARPGVEPACLQLQSAGINVCLLLCGLWLGERGVTCNEHRLQQLRSVAEPWDADVVQPLRALRVNWRVVATDDSELNALREQVKALELQAERHLLVRLERLALSWPQDEATDLSAWLESVAAGAAHLDRDALHQLRVAVTGT
ncbi:MULTISPECIES: TIGR02444 family protein [unclassified Pseudomonas]|uniref:TIGR02444 family protein n=1 Tax=unclassified Pseudomonas TaxID=196821 RepID=UPI000C877385|nr:MULTISPECIES: TIGR02444 family protein [unclassified Pseudomonas]PMU10038.1 TIGR02444 family protein [Pseudomonas sp. FW305-20]PMU15613.1 TIGR02444 family protein [Pseudomonas sp. FW305-122]PMU37453.1 TIGR02444 family protein [Pseudomonas sp. FW305-47B]PMX60120.1 TIGR02444 family protein [Pseudomonas sp. FW305-33]PMX63579.1 TIGR02444 family protein [Pseudomonas sp. FW305-60]